MNMKRGIICAVMAVMAGFFALSVMIVAQDAQDMQNQEKALRKEISANAERIKVLQAEWAYLTRPEYLEKIVKSIEPDATWKTIKGGDMTAMNELLLAAPEQVAMAQGMMSGNNLIDNSDQAAVKAQ